MIRPTTHPASAPGITLLELGLTIMILGVISVGVSGLVKTGVESQLSQRVHQNMQVIALNIVDDIRMDMRTACSAAVQNSGNRLIIDTPPCAAPNAATQANIVYERTGGNDFVRTEGGVTKRYNDPNLYSFPLQVDCQNVLTGSTACFQATLFNNDASPKAKQVEINAIRVYQATPVGGGSMIDVAFGMPNFVVRNINFDVMAATEFQ